MISDSGQPSLNPPEEGHFPRAGENDLPQSWMEAIPCLIASRISIIRAESKDVVGSAAGKIALLAVAAFCLILVWLLLLAGLAGAIAAATSWEWYHVVFAEAGAHVLVAAVAFMIALSKSTAPAFPITRSEFEKDREWLNQLKKPSNSED